LVKMRRRRRKRRKRRKKKRTSLVQLELEQEHSMPLGCEQVSEVPGETIAFLKYSTFNRRKKLRGLN